MQDINSIQQTLTSNVTSNINSYLSSQVSSIINLIAIPSLIVTSLILLLYIIRAIRRYRIEKAIFEIRDSLREIKLMQSSPAQDLPAKKDQL